MKKHFLFVVAIIGSFSVNLYAQEVKTGNADKQYNKYAYIDAIKIYETLAAKGHKSADMLKKLGNSYYFNSDYESAARWYEELFAMGNSVEPEYYYRYAQCLKSIGQLDKANKIMGEFNALNNNDSRGKLFKETTDYLNQITANSGRYKIEDAGVNSKYSDYGTIVYKNKIYFASARDTGNFTQRKHTWTGRYFTNIYDADIDSVTKNVIKVNKFKTSINTKFNESSPVFSKDGNTVYFTRNNYVKGKKGKNGDDITLIKIYKATFENGKWTNIVPLSFTSDNYSTAHPALSSDEKTMYFASDMPGTLGQSDLYKVSINGDGSFGLPQNLGKTVNTEGKETFPFVTSENEIYFASDGHPGLGGLDVFVGQLEENGTINNIQNVGNDINSPKDDFAYIIDPISRKGYFSSNKDGGQGSDDIYMFTETRKLKCIQELNGIVTDVATGIILPEAKVSLYENQVLKNTTVSDTTGFYVLPVDCSKTYSVRAEKIDYEPKEVVVSTGNIMGKTSLPIALESSRCVLKIGDDLGKCFGIKMIYFDLDKSDIRGEAVLDLEKILAALNNNPTMKLDIRSYTDSRATLKYNQSLSDKRARSTINWLVEKGISKERLTGKGYGETQLLNDCADGVKCTEEQHQMNRRSEFIITAL